MQTVAWDTETFKFGPGNMAPQIVVSSFCREHDNWLMSAFMPSHKQEMDKLLADAALGRCIIVGHNVAYDMACLMACEPDLIPAVFAAYDADGVTDTMARQKLIDIARGQYRGYTNGATGWIKHGYSLADLYLRHFNEKLDKDQNVRTGYDALWGVLPEHWPEAHVRYALKDSQATLQVWSMQQIDDAQLAGAYLADQYRQTRAALALHLIEVWGIHTDEAAIKRLHEWARAEIEKVRGVLIEAGLLRNNGSRNMKLALERMAAVWPACPKTPTGRPQINPETCEESGDTTLMALARYAQMQNVCGKDVRELMGGTQYPIHTRYDSLVETGRTSSSAPNIQNIKRLPGVRECFIPRRGFVLCACDFAQIELYTLAQVQYDVFGKSTLGEALNAGLDPHLLVAAETLRISYDEALARKKDPDVKQARQNAKPDNFGLAGGMGAKGLLAYAKGAYGVSFTLDEAKAMIDVYNRTWPDMEDYFEWVRVMIGDSGSTTIRHIRSDRVRGHIPYTVTCNSFFQGLASDVAKHANYEVAKLQYVPSDNALFGTRTVNFVHDELDVEVPDEPQAAHDAAMELKRVMEVTASLWLPNLKPKAEPTLMRRWSKSAEQVWKNGLLVPWEN